MSNQRAEGVSYTKMKPTPVLSDGLLSVDRDDGGPQRRVAAAFGRLADEAGAIGDQYAAVEGAKQGELDALNGAPGASSISGGTTRGDASATAYAGGPVRAARIDDADMTGRAKRIRDGLLRRGLTPLMAAAAVGHGVQESSLRAAGPDGDKGTSSGIFQWRNERRAALQSFAAASGKDWQDEDTQLDFFVHELKTRERRAWSGLQSARNLDEATAALMHFERPQGYTARNPRGGHGWQNRLQNATWAAQLGGAPEAVAMAAEPPRTGAAAAIGRQMGGDGRPQGRPVSKATNFDIGSLRPLKSGEFRANPDGSYSTELTVTVPDGAGKWINVPSLWMGDDGWVELSEDDAAAAAAGFEKKGEKFPRFDSVAKAEAAASARSKAGGVAEGQLAGSDGGAARAGITPESVAPPSVTPVSVTAGKAGGFRPTGAMTIRGRAYDTAGTRTYLEQLDTTMRTDVEAVYERFKDDPDQLAQGFQALRNVHQDEHVFPEIRADYDNAYARLTTPYLRKARADRDKKVKEQNTADFMMRTQELEDGTARAIERFDGPDAADVLASSQEATDAHYDSAVARGIMTAPEAANAKLVSRRNAAVGFYLKQADKAATPEDVAAMRKQMSEDFGAGTLDGVDADAWTKIDANLEIIEKKKREGDRVASKALTERGDALADAVFAGGSPMSPEISKFMLDAKTAPDGQAIVKRSMDRVAVAQLLRDKPLAEGEAIVRDLEGKPDAQASGLAEYARKSFDGMRKAVQENVVGAAEARGLIAQQPDLFADGDPSAVAGRLRSRIDAAESAAEHFGVRPTYLKPGEAAALKSLADTDPDAAAAMAGSLVEGAGGRASLVLGELKGDAPAITQAGMIIAGGGSPRAARDVIAGYGKGPDGQSRPALGQKLRQKGETDTFGDAFAGSPQDGEAIEAAGHAIAKVRIEEAGVDPKSPEAEPIYAQALQEAAGAIVVRGVQYGGVADYAMNGWFGGGFAADHVRVVVPPTIRADRFADVIDAIRDDDLVEPKGERGRVTRYFSAPPVDAAGKPYKAADLKGARPVAVAGGYRFAFGDPSSDDPQWVRGADGRPFVLAIDTMRTRLEPRVPGAFR